LEKTDTQDVLNPHAAELTDVDLGGLVVLKEAEDKGSDVVLERPQLTTSALKRGLQLVGGLINNYFINQKNLQYFLQLFILPASCI
jgi:hypothetical protein